MPPRSRRSALVAVEQQHQTPVAVRRVRTRRPRAAAAEVAEVAVPATFDWATVDRADLASPALFINRELSWIEFNQRVLSQAQDAHHPLLERVKFLSIAGSNLDEFFMVRVATILKKLRADIDDVSMDGLNTEQELAAIRRRALAQMDQMSACWSQALRPLKVKEYAFVLPTEKNPSPSSAWVFGSSMNTETVARPSE